MERFKRQGVKLRPEDEPPPPPGPECALYVRAWVDLCATRQVGFNGPQPIALSEMASWLDLRGWRDTSARAAVVDVIRALDAVYMEHAANAARAAQSESESRLKAQGQRSRG